MKETSYEIVVRDNYGTKVYERVDYSGAMKVYEQHKQDPLVREIIVQEVERLVVKRLFDGKESNY